MENIKEKLVLATELDRDILQIEEFINLIYRGQSKYEDNDEKQNKFSRLILEGYIWTGSDTSNYETQIYDNEIIKSFCNAGKIFLTKELEDKKKKLHNLFL